jgi:arylsulfatase A-like enzyme
VPVIIRWPGMIPAGKVENGIISELDWFPTFVAAAGYRGDIAADLRQDKNFGGRTYKVHLDGYNQIDMLTGRGPPKHHEIFYFTETTLASVRLDDYKFRFHDQTSGWLGATEKVNWRFWPIRVSTRSSAWECITAKIMGRSPITTGLYTSSGALCSCSGR